jgi:putative DNA primase/helicase
MRDLSSDSWESLYGLSDLLFNSYGDDDYDDDDDDDDIDDYQSDDSDDFQYDDSDDFSTDSQPEYNLQTSSDEILTPSFYESLKSFPDATHESEPTACDKDQIPHSPSLPDLLGTLGSLEHFDDSTDDFSQTSKASGSKRHEVFRSQQADSSPDISADDVSFITALVQQENPAEPMPVPSVISSALTAPLPQKASAAVSERPPVSAAIPFPAEKVSSVVTKPKTPPLASLAEKLKERQVFILYNECLYHYNGRYYSPIDQEGTIRLYRECVDSYFGNAPNMHTMRDLYSCLITDSSIREVTLDRSRPVCSLQNGVFDIESQRLVPHSPDFIVFSSLCACYIPNYEGKCPYFEEYLNHVTGGNPTLIDLLWKFLGYIFTQPAEGKFIFWLGFCPHSGKSTLGNLIAKLFPRRCISKLSTTDLGSKFELASLLGSEVNLSLDVSSSVLNPEAVSRLKCITGGDGITIQRKYLSSADLDRRIKFIFASNAPLRLTENDDAFWNRLVYIPFNHQVPSSQDDMYLDEKIYKERDAIVSKALLYAKYLIDDGYRFPTTPGIERAMEQMRGIANPSIESFVDDACDLSDKEAITSTAQLFQQYTTYCQERNFIPVSHTELKHFLESSLGLKHLRYRVAGASPKGHPVSSFQGIRLIDDPV